MHIIVNHQNSILINNEIYVDPLKINDKGYAKYIFITHPHWDHFSVEDIKKVLTKHTKIICPKTMQKEILNLFPNDVVFVEPNKSYNLDGISFDTFPSYNINKKYHPKDNQWLGYLITIDNEKVAIIGDVAHSRVARSNIYALNKLGAEVVLGAPATLMPRDISELGVKAYENVETAIKDADVVMCLRLQKERQQSGLLPSMREYSKFFGLNSERLKLAKEDALIMHPGPVNRGIELCTEVMDLDRAVIDEQVTNGVAVRMAVLNILAKRS